MRTVLSAIIERKGRARRGGRQTRCLSSGKPPSIWRIGKKNPVSRASQESLSPSTYLAVPNELDEVVLAKDPDAETAAGLLGVERDEGDARHRRRREGQHELGRGPCGPETGKA